MAGLKKDSPASRVFLSEDIITNILLQLPTASCIARFRCVCRSWRALLSDPDFIRRIIFQNPADRQSLRILIAGAENGVSPARKIYYSLHSYETLCPIISATGEDNHNHPLPSIPYKVQDRWSEFILDIIGCCDGIFCISDVNHLGAGDIILWNPTTSEIKYLPLSPCPHHISLEAYHQHTGFGFDPVTRDYKVVRRLLFRRDREYELYDEEVAPEFTYNEVYSLKNNSWKRLFIDDGGIIYCSDSDYVHRYPDTSRNERCYWFNSDYEGSCSITSFHMSREVFEVVTLALPSGKSDWRVESCIMLKELFVATFAALEYSISTPYEIWGLMNGAAESWTKLFSFQLSTDVIYDILEVWKDGMYICSMESVEDSTSDHAGEEVGGLYILDHTICNSGNRLDIEGRTRRFQVHAYTPTRTSLSSLE